MAKFNKKLGILINKRRFTLDDQLQFAMFSADSNPIHIDPVIARRTIAGECIVHGVHSLMYAINSLLKHNRLTIISFQVSFSKPILLGIEVCCFWDVENNKLSIASENTIYVSIFLTLGSILRTDNISNINLGEPLIVPTNMTLNECSEFTREDLVYRGNIKIGENLFPDLFEIYGFVFAAELALISEIVGMQIPGLNSLLLSLNSCISEKNTKCYYELISCNLRFRIMKILINGKYLKSEIDVFYRPSSTNSPSMSQISKKIKGNEFTNVNALIIGGSRGLGEITAKIITCGGGRVTITYNLGEADAKKLRNEILEYGKSCNIFKLKIEDQFYIPEENFNQIYYFPSPKIKAEDFNISNTNLTQLYELFYVDFFRNLLTQVLEKDMQSSIFYPSTTYLSNAPKNFTTYVESKLKGELLCKEFIETKSMRIIYPRLPRLATDQTLGLINEKFQDSVDTLYPLILSMVNRIKFC
jgi:hypothetical protein